jgi:hypothetical protein
MSNAEILKQISEINKNQIAFGKQISEINKNQIAFQKQFNDFITKHDTSTLSIRTDIETVKTAGNANRDSVLESYNNNMIGQTAELASLTDRVFTTWKTEFKNITPKRVTKANSTTSSTSTLDKSEKNATNVDAHCNFGKLPQTSWKSSKQYATKMFKLYPEHINAVLGEELMTAILENKNMTDLTDDLEPHKRSLAFSNTIWKMLSSDLKTRAIDLIEADRITENNIRINGTFNHVATEGISTEEADAIADAISNTEDGK